MPTGAGGVWTPDPNPLLGVAQTVGQIQENALYPLRRQQLQTEVQTRQQALAQAQTDSLGQMFASTQSDAEMPGALERAVNAHLIAPDVAAGLVGQGPTAWSTLRNQALVRYGTAPEVRAGIGETVQTNVGGQIVGQNVRTSPEGSAITPATGAGAALQTTLTPGEAQTPAYTRFNNQTQQQEVVTKAAAAANPTNPVGIPGSAPLGAEAAANVYAGGQAQDALGITRAMAQVPQHKAALDNMRDQVDQFASGPQSGLWQGIGAFFSQFGLDPSALNRNLGTNATAAKTEFDKLGLAVLATQARQAGLSGTDQQNAMAAASSPHSTMTPLAIKRMLGVIEGGEDYLKAQGDAWLRYAKAHPGVPQADFQAAFNARYDPRVFQAQYLDAEAKAAMLKGMSPAQQKLFRARYNDAVQRGLINAGQ